MIDLLGKKIIGTTMDDARFLRGQNVEDALENGFQFGKEFIIKFDDGSRLIISLVKDGEDESLIGLMINDGSDN
jgi:hypothetical protein